jgi:hypothetical protein
VIGVAVFALDRMFAVRQSHGTIVLDAKTHGELLGRFEDTFGRAPDMQEHQRLVDDWVREELLYREGLALGLDRDDVQIRSRLAKKMGYVVEGMVTVAEPSDSDLRAHRPRARVGRGGRRGVEDPGS